MSRARSGNHIGQKANELKQESSFILPSRPFGVGRLLQSLVQSAFSFKTTSGLRQASSVALLSPSLELEGFVFQGLGLETILRGKANGDQAGAH